MSLENIVGTILVRDHYRWTRIHYASRLAAALVALLAVSLLSMGWLMSKPAEYRYILTDVTGKVVDMVPLNRPNVDDEALKAWTVDATTRLYTFDFQNYRAQFQRAQSLMTVHGWAQFEKAMIESGNFNAVIRNRYVTTAVPTAPAKILNAGLLTVAGGESRYTWTVEFPVSITYRARTRSTTQDLTMRVVVARVPEYVSDSGLQIRQIVAR